MKDFELNIVRIFQFNLLFLVARILLCVPRNFSLYWSTFLSVTYSIAT
jgi:hypothetical protein